MTGILLNQQDLFSGQIPADSKENNSLFIGTSGYIFPDWRGNFYPEKLPQNRWLDFYAEQFDTVEINAPYYHLPPRSTFESMVKRTVENYPFWVKIPGELTHRGGDVAYWMGLFKQAIAPLKEAGRLAGALAQFPFSLGPTTVAKRLLSNLRNECDTIPLAVEIRHNAWQTKETAEYFRKEGITTVIPDLPILKNLPTPELLVTSNIAYIRFHGRNANTWNNPAMGDRYDYDYSLEELTEWIPKIASLMATAETTFIFFNNCHMGQAVKNAKMLKSLLQNQIGEIN